MRDCQASGGWADLWDRPARTRAQSGLYGTVGTCPAVSWASRCALSPFSWLAFSLEWKAPPLCDAEPEPAVDGWLLLVAVVVVAALLDAALTTVAPSAPPAIDPATIAAIMPRRMMDM
jgi:hypothetical protein